MAVCCSATASISCVRLVSRKAKVVAACCGVLIGASCGRGAAATASIGSIMHRVDFVEIGTADFDTLAQQLVGTEATGLSVEPVRAHLDALPSDGRLRKKVHAAITERDGWADLFTVRPEFVEPQCTGETLPSTGLPYCLPWWFRAIASMYRPSDLVEVHAGQLAAHVQETIRVKTLSYGSLLSTENVSDVGLLKIDTEGFDVQILSQVLEWGTTTGHWPERIQFEKNNLTDAAESAPVLAALQSFYECWAPPGDDDVHCARLRDLAAGRPAASSSAAPGGEASHAVDTGPYCTVTAGEEIRPWWRVELPDHISVARVRLVGRGDCCAEDLGKLEVRIGDHALETWKNAFCASGREASLAGSGLRTFHCLAEGRYLAVLLPIPTGSTPRPLALCHLEALGVATERGSTRVSTSRQCCHGDCHQPQRLFDGFDPACEARCLADSACRFFTTYSSLWCSTSESCDEDMPTSDQSAMTFAAPSRRVSPWLPLPLGNARQSSEAWGGTAAGAVDGRFEPHFMAGSCSHTVVDDEASTEQGVASQGHWWVGELLGGRSAVAAVRVLNRIDCCHERLDGWEVRVGDDPDPRRNPRCIGKSAKEELEGAVVAGGRRLVECRGPLIGRYVGVVLPHGEALTLCEVEAFATRVMFEKLP
eukprot:TRINITY_DN28840_c1_g2_i1.p1 TRINITY_DN28840_c1_g2~~TRINITY_DN28840_c1_g2_i1.p1  ORF type:complete len:744 (-),score=88.35 TRINITY_DN28840_c1_g2_i1:51-2000(-)